MTKSPLKLLALLLLILAGMTACEKLRDPCLEPKAVSLRMGAYKPADTGTAGVDSLLPNVTLGAIDNDTLKVVVLNAKRVNKFSILLSPIADSARWWIRPDSASGFSDTITFYYQRKLQFLSNACGYTYYYTLQNVSSTNNTVDSIKINNSEVTNDANVEHVKIFF